MAASEQEKAFCVLEFAKTTSVSSVQQHFRTHYGKNPPTRKSIYDWCKQFQGKGCLCKGKSTGRFQVLFSNKMVRLLTSTWMYAIT
jgi:transposase